MRTPGEACGDGPAEITATRRDVHRGRRRHRVAPSGYAVDRATVRQKKTGRPVRFELTEQTRQAVHDYIKAAGKKPGEFLFSGRGDHNRSMTTRQYARLVSIWVATIGLDPHFFGLTSEL